MRFGQCELLLVLSMAFFKFRSRESGYDFTCADQVAPDGFSDDDNLRNGTVAFTILTGVLSDWLL